MLGVGCSVLIVGVGGVRVVIECGSVRSICLYGCHLHAFTTMREDPGCIFRTPGPSRGLDRWYRRP